MGTSKSVIIVCLFVIVGEFISHISGQCCYGSGAGCRLCNCLNNARCNAADGVCNNCPGTVYDVSRFQEYNWRNSTCQIGNVVRSYLPTSQTHHLNTSKLAADWKFLEENWGTDDVCAEIYWSNETDMEITWEIDLMKDHVIYEIYIHNTNRPNVWQHMVNFEVQILAADGRTVDWDRYIYDTSQPDSRPGPVPPMGRYNWTLSNPVIGRRVKFSKIHNYQLINGHREVRLCEVVVIGQLYSPCLFPTTTVPRTTSAQVDSTTTTQPTTTVDSTTRTTVETTSAATTEPTTISTSAATTISTSAATTVLTSTTPVPIETSSVDDIFTTHSLRECCYGNGSGCRPCNCINGFACEQSNGTCEHCPRVMGDFVRNPEYNWIPPTCQIGNIINSTMHFNSTPSQNLTAMVDSKYNESAANPDVCAEISWISPNNMKLYWEVNLGADYVIYAIAMHNTARNEVYKHMVNFDMRVIASNLTVVANDEYIYDTNKPETRQGPVPAGGRYIWQLPYPVVGKYISFTKNLSYQQVDKHDVVRVCELVVIGELYAPCIGTPTPIPTTMPTIPITTTTATMTWKTEESSETEIGNTDIGNTDIGNTDIGNTEWTTYSNVNSTQSGAPRQSGVPAVNSIFIALVISMAQHYFYHKSY